MNLNKTSDNGSHGSSINNISSHKERKYDTIPFRIDFIRELLDNNELKSLIDFEKLDTETFMHPNGYSCGSTDNQYDIRNILDKQKLDFYKIIREIGGKLLYVKSGTTGHTFKGMVQSDDGINIYYAVKVVAYPKRERYGNLNDVRRPENAELMMIRLLSYFVVKKQTPHIVLPIGTFYTSIKPFVNLIEDNTIAKDQKRYLEFIEKFKSGEYYDNVSILISEWANRGDLLEFIRKNYRDFTLLHWKVLFFQIISVLAVIQSKFPSFRHNDLKANNILIHRINQRGTLYSYTVCKKIYIVPNIGYQIKLWDFDFACIPGVVDNAKVNDKWTDEINVKPIQNRYYDMHYFFNTFIKKGFFSEFIEEKCIPQEAKEFVMRVVPAKYQNGSLVTKRGRILVNEEYLIPNDVLKTDKFFEEFRNHKAKKKLK